MTGSEPTAASCLRPARPAAPAPRPTIAKRPREIDDRKAERVLLCALCGSKVTTDSARISVKGAHEHTFANPGGYVFHIGCFSSATGCHAIPPPSSEWSWFPGSTWEIALCGACDQHLGWRFQSSAAVFHGLILDRLRLAESSRQP